MRLKTPSAPLVVSLTPPMGTLPSEQWLAAFASVIVRLWKTLSEDSYIRLPSASTSWHPQLCQGSMIGYGMEFQVELPLDGLFFFPCYTLFLCISSHGYFIPPSKKGFELPYLEIHAECGLYDGHCELLGWYPLISECSFMNGLPHSGWYFKVPSICLRTAWIIVFNGWKALHWMCDIWCLFICWRISEFFPVSDY